MESVLDVHGSSPKTYIRAWRQILPSSAFKLPVKLEVSAPDVPGVRANTKSLLLFLKFWLFMRAE